MCMGDHGDGANQALVQDGGIQLMDRRVPPGVRLFQRDGLRNHGRDDMLRLDKTTLWSLRPPLQWMAHSSLVIWPFVRGNNAGRCQDRRVG